MRSVGVKIFIGPCEIGKIAGTLGCAFRDRRIKVTVVRNHVTPFQAGMKYDQTIHFANLNKFQRGMMCLQFFIKAFSKHDAFIFLFGQTLLPYNLDLSFSKILSQKNHNVVFRE